MSIGCGIGASWQSQPAPWTGALRHTQAQPRLDKTRLDSSRLHTNFLDGARSLSPPVVTPRCPLLQAAESAGASSPSARPPARHPPPSFSLLGAARGQLTNPTCMPSSCMQRRATHLSSRATDAAAPPPPPPSTHHCHVSCCCCRSCSYQRT